MGNRLGGRNRTSEEEEEEVDSLETEGTETEEEMGVMDHKEADNGSEEVKSVGGSEEEEYRLRFKTQGSEIEKDGQAEGEPGETKRFSGTECNRGIDITQVNDKPNYLAQFFGLIYLRRRKCEVKELGEARELEKAEVIEKVRDVEKPEEIEKVKVVEKAEEIEKVKDVEKAEEVEELEPSMKENSMNKYNSMKVHRIEEMDLTNSQTTNKKDIHNINSMPLGSHNGGGFGYAKDDYASDSEEVLKTFGTMVEGFTDTIITNDNTVITNYSPIITKDNTTSDTTHLLLDDSTDFVFASRDTTDIPLERSHECLSPIKRVMLSPSSSPSKYNSSFFLKSPARSLPRLPSSNNPAQRLSSRSTRLPLKLSLLPRCSFERQRLLSRQTPGCRKKLLPAKRGGKTGAAEGKADRESQWINSCSLEETLRNSNSVCHRGSERKRFQITENKKNSFTPANSVKKRPCSAACQSKGKQTKVSHTLTTTSTTTASPQSNTPVMPSSVPVCTKSHRSFQLTASSFDCPGSPHTSCNSTSLLSTLLLIPPP